MADNKIAFKCRGVALKLISCTFAVHNQRRKEEI